MSEDSFIIPQFAPFDQAQIELINQDHEFYETPIIVKQRRADRKLSYNHYSDCSKRVEIEGASGGFLSSIMGESKSNIIE